MFNKKTPTIKFISTVEGLSDVIDCKPKPAGQYTPLWWKNVPMIKTNIGFDGVEAGSIKNCPSFPDFFSQGYIMPMWADTLLYIDNETQTWKARQSSKDFSLHIHPPYQYLDHVDHKFMGKDSYFIFKLHSPWQIMTDPGYSIYQMPTFYHFNEDFSILPGIIDTDIYYQTNLQLVIHSNKKEILIPRGTPLAHYVIYKREKINGLVRDANKKDKHLIKKLETRFTTKFGGSKEYIKMRKERDKND
jgi:hypothetical protein